MRKLKLPSPGLVVAVVALLVALSGTAIAAQSVVPLAKRALTADKAKVATLALNSQKLGGQTSAALVSQAVTQASAAPGPASTVPASLVVIKSAPIGSLPSLAVSSVQISCDAGQTAIGGGVSSDTGLTAIAESYPVNPTTWKVGAGNLGAATANATGYAICLK